MKQLIFIFLFTAVTFAQNDFFFYWDSDEADLTPPSTPQNLLATGGSGEIVLTWDANSDDDLSRYVLYYYTSDDSSSSSALDSVYAGTETITHSGLSYGVTYYYWLVAVDSTQNRSWYSDVASDVVGALLGDELVTNGAFDADASWDKGTGWTIADGVASCDGSQGGYSWMQQTISGGNNLKTYKIIFTVTISAGTIFATIGGNEYYFLGISPDNGTYTYTKTFTVESSEILQIGGDLDFVGTLDNISLREVLNP